MPPSNPMQTQRQRSRRKHKFTKSESVRQIQTCIYPAGSLDLTNMKMRLTGIIWKFPECLDLIQWCNKKSQTQMLMAKENRCKVNQFSEAKLIYSKKKRIYWQKINENNILTESNMLHRIEYSGEGIKTQSQPPLSLNKHIPHAGRM